MGAMATNLALSGLPGDSGHLPAVVVAPCDIPTASWQIEKGGEGPAATSSVPVGPVRDPPLFLAVIAACCDPQLSRMQAGVVLQFQA